MVEGIGAAGGGMGRMCSRVFDPEGVFDPFSFFDRLRSCCSFKAAASLSRSSSSRVFFLPLSTGESVSPVGSPYSELDWLSGPDVGDDGGVRSRARRSRGAGGSFRAGENVPEALVGGLAGAVVGGEPGGVFWERGCKRFAVKLDGATAECESWPSRCEELRPVFKGVRDRLESLILPSGFGGIDDPLLETLVCTLGDLSCVP